MWNGMKAYRASRLFDVLWSTFIYKFKEKSLGKNILGLDPYLSTKLETRLNNWVVKMVAIKKPVSKLNLMLSIRKYC